MSSHARGQFFGVKLVLANWLSLVHQRVGRTVTVRSTLCTHGIATGDYFADQLLRIQGKDRLAGDFGDRACDCRSCHFISCIIVAENPLSIPVNSV